MRQSWTGCLGAICRRQWCEAWSPRAKAQLQGPLEAQLQRPLEASCIRQQQTTLAQHQSVPGLGNLSCQDCTVLLLAADQ